MPKFDILLIATVEADAIEDAKKKVYAELDYLEHAAPSIVFNMMEDETIPKEKQTI